MSKPQIQAIMTANTSGIRKGAKEVETTVNALGKKIRSAMGDSLRHSMTAVGATISATVGAVLTKTVRSGMQQAFAMEGSQVAMESMLGSLDKAREAMGMIAQEARENPMFSKEALAESAQALVGFADKSVPKLKGLVELSEKLSTLKPEAGVANAAQALRDAIGGETERLKEYGFGSKELSQMKANAGPGADLSAAIAKALDAKGINEATLMKMSQSRQSQLMAIENQLANVGEGFTNSFWPKIQPQLAEMQTWMTANSDKIIAGMTTVGDGIVLAYKGIKSGADAIDKGSSWIADKFFQDWYSPKNSRHNLEGPIHGAGAFFGNLLTGQGWDKSVAAGMQAQTAQTGAVLGPRAKELAPQVNIRMSAPTGGMMPGMQHT